MDYGKFKFDATKREKELKRNHKSSGMREMRLSMNIDTHDMQTKARQTIKLLTDGDKVKVSIRMRGREQAHSKLGVGVMDSFFALCEAVSVVDVKAHTEGRNIFMILAPKKPEKNKDKGDKAKSKAVEPKPEALPATKLTQNMAALADKLQRAEQRVAKPVAKPAVKPKDNN
jgi:translation initiation factor IF-3